MFIGGIEYIDKAAMLAYANSYANNPTKELIMQSGRHVRLFRNGRSQAIRIPKEFELEGNEAVIHKEGGRLIIEPVKRISLLALLAGWKPLLDGLPDISDSEIEAEEIF